MIRRVMLKKYPYECDGCSKVIHRGENVYTDAERGTGFFFCSIECLETFYDEWEEEGKRVGGD